MNLQVVKNIMVKMDLRPADVAKMAGVSRAAVSRWFRQSRDSVPKNRGWVNVETATIQRLANHLGLPPGFFLTERKNLGPLTPFFLWDHLYPDMENFVKALARNRPQAFARLVQSLGFHQANLIMGKKVIDLFPSYKRYIHPARRRQLEILWPLYN